LETNQVVRHYHGHLSGVYCLALHPTLDLLITGGRDAVARVWDIRSRTQVHCLTGHDHTVASVLVKTAVPHVVTGSHDCTVRMWDLVAGKCFTTLTQHQKSVRALAQPVFEHSFVSGAADCLKKWQGKDGRLIQTWNSNNNNSSRPPSSSGASSSGNNKLMLVNALAVNDDGVLVSGGDDGTMHFWDYATGHNFQTARSVAQPGSLDYGPGV
jgi:pleiotropic regulator 1